MPSKLVNGAEREELENNTSMESTQRKKVLIITYYWPPAGGPGVQRIVKFVKYLPEFGFDPIVLTVAKGEYPALDPSLSQEIPTSVRVVRTRSFEFFSLFKRLTGRKKEARINTTILKAEPPGWKDRIFRWIRYNFFFPDARIGWKYYAINAGKKLIRQEKPDLIFCTSPPHSAQWIARRLHQYSGLPWVADFRDPWTDAYWLGDLHKYPRALAKNLKMEKQVLAEATELITVSKGYQEILNKVNRRPVLIRNGFDGADFQGQKERNETFQILYTGSLSQIQMPDNLLQAIAKLPESIKNKVRFDLYGAIDDAFGRRVDALGIAKQVHVHGYIPHAEAIQRMIQADMLVLLTPSTPSKGMTPLKLYEYLAAGPFILGIGKVDSEPAELLRQFGGGQYVEYETDVFPILQERLDSWRTNPYSQSERLTDVKALSRRNLTAKLASVFQDVLVLSS